MRARHVLTNAATTPMSGSLGHSNRALDFLLTEAAELV